LQIDAGLGHRIDHNARRLAAAAQEVRNPDGIGMEELP
jgi:hypothetical protein